MELFIRIKNGEPFEHPILGSNFREAFPDIDVDNLPPEYARFERVVAPELGPYEKNQRVQYERGEDGVYRDVWYCDNMTDVEITARQNEVKAQWAASDFTDKSWVFDEATCSYRPSDEIG